MGLRVQGLGLRVQGLGLRVQGLGLRVQGLGLRVSLRNGAGHARSVRATYGRPRRGAVSYEQGTPVALFLMSEVPL